MWYVYIVECNDSSLYTGITVNIARRIKEHNDGSGAKSLIPKRPVQVVYFEKHNNRSNAAKREKEIKGWVRKKKLQLIEGFTLIPYIDRRVYPDTVYRSKGLP